MKSIEHIIVAYGYRSGYYHGAKYQILKAWRSWYSRENVSICVVTDLPDVFENYPVRILSMTKDQKQVWSLNGTQHFGIKLKGIEWACRTSQADLVCALDTDSYWKKDPCKLLLKLDSSSVAMFSDEGLIKGSRNKSIQQFNKGLEGKLFELSDGSHYRLHTSSRMLNSSIIAMTRRNQRFLTEAWELFKTLEPMVNAHTVEQFSLAETFRTNAMTILFGNKLGVVGNWSSTGRKDHVTPLLDRFFSEYGENDFEKHLKMFSEIKLRRPLATIVKQKISKIAKTRNPRCTRETETENKFL